MPWVYLFSLLYVLLITECHETHWISATNSDWNNFVNWDNGVPSSNSTVVVVDSQVSIFAFDFVEVNTLNSTNSRIVFANDANFSTVFTNSVLEFKTKVSIGQLVILNYGSVDLRDAEANVSSISNGGKIILSSSSLVRLSNTYSR